MLKLFTIAILAFIAAPALAAPSACMQGIVDAQGWNGLTSQQIECIAANDQVKTSLAQLCSQDQTQFSDSYTTYRKYEAAYKDALNNFQAATDEGSKDVAILNLRSIDQEWKTFGFKNEVIASLWPISQAKSNCR
jgi:hypothetical protein